MIPLSKLQKEIMEEFYNTNRTKVIFDKKSRNALWKKATKKEPLSTFSGIINVCPALYHQIQKSYESGNNIQSAVFSECVYAQTFANMLQLKVFVNCFENHSFIPNHIQRLLGSYNLFPRYAYSNDDMSRLLIQAGGCNGIDSALVSVSDLNIYTIEFKEPGAKTSEPDLPKYGEDGKLIATNDFIKRYPQFESMVREKEGISFFDVMGNNIHDFSAESVSIAVTNNYSKKYADVICTEDKNGCLTMIPANQISCWADVEGEIRPAGRNAYSVWTPIFLRTCLIEKKAVICGNRVTISSSELGIRRARGGDKKITGYKINPLFFVYTEKCTLSNGLISFDLLDVKQLNPTIAGKLFFGNLLFENVRQYYFG